MSSKPASNEMPEGGVPGGDSEPGLHAVRRRRSWQPEQDAEAAALLRRLCVTPWLIAGRDDDAIAAARRLEPPLTDAASRLGWAIVIERDLVRLRKSPPPRPAAWAADGPSPLDCSWFFLLVAAAESAPSRVAIGTLVSAARVAAAEAGLPSTNDMSERRAIVRALHLLDERGIVERVDGDVDTFLTDEQAPVLLAVRHTRLAHVVANPGTLNPAEQPHAWLEQVQREPDAARRMRRALVDDTCVHTALLDPAEANWLSRRGRSDDGLPLAQAFGLGLERRVEGAAFIVPDDAYRAFLELGPRPFPMPGTVAHAALLLVDHANINGTRIGGPGTGWRGMREDQVLTALTGLAADYTTGRGGWGAEYAGNLPKLAAAVRQLLCGANLLLLGDDTPEDPRGTDSPDTAVTEPDDDGFHRRHRWRQSLPGSAPGGTAPDATTPDAPASDALTAGPTTPESALTGTAPAVTWWFAPVTGRWAEEGSATPRTGRHRAGRARADTAEHTALAAPSKAGTAGSPGELRGLFDLPQPAGTGGQP